MRNPYKKFNVSKWNRKEAFAFFKEYDDPFFNVTTQLEVTSLYHYCQKNKISFFLASLYYTLKIANQIPEFRLRFKKEEVVIYDRIDAGATILNEDGETFSFCYLDFLESLEDFLKEGTKRVEAQKKKGTLKEKKSKLNLIYFSSLPWVSFTSMKHARHFDKQQSIPKIAFGKLYNERSIWKLPFSVEVNHALMDGRHVGLFIEELQKKLS